jgi:hypothetical protein
MAKSEVSVQLHVKRGQESWTFIYIVMAIALGIEIGIVQLLPLPSNWWNIAMLAFLIPLTIWLFLRNFWLQDVLIGLKGRYENKGHTR